MPDKKKKLRFDDPKKNELPYRKRKGYRRLVVEGHVFQWRHHEPHLLVIIGPDDRRETFDLSPTKRDVGCDCGWYDDCWCFYDMECTGGVTPILPSDAARHAKSMLRWMQK